MSERRPYSELPRLMPPPLPQRGRPPALTLMDRLVAWCLLGCGVWLAAWLVFG